MIYITESGPLFFVWPLTVFFNNRLSYHFKWSVLLISYVSPPCDFEDLTTEINIIS